MKTHYLILFNPRHERHFNQQLKTALRLKARYEQRGQNPNWHIHYVSPRIPAQALQLREVALLAQRQERQASQHIAQLNRAFHTAPIEHKLTDSRLSLLYWRLKHGWSETACLMPQQRRTTLLRRFKWRKRYRHTKGLSHFSAPVTI